MRLIDEQYQDPHLGVTLDEKHLRRLGYKINRKRVQRLMRLMGLEAIYPKPKTSRPHPQHKIDPYLLRGLTIDRPNQVWAADITYVPMSRGFMYLVAVMDWHSRRCSPGECPTPWRQTSVSRRSPRLSGATARQRYSTPTRALSLPARPLRVCCQSRGVAVSMDGRGRRQDNIFIERLWWTVKHHYVYLHSFGSGSELRDGLRYWFNFYNRDRFHQSLDNLTRMRFTTDFLIHSRRRPDVSGCESA